MNETSSCCCGGGPKMVFACSGAADVGEITDRAARELQRKREAFMCCTAAIAADATEIVAKARQAEGVLAIDGCAELCAKKILEGAGFENFPCIRLDELGMEKGKTPIDDAAIGRVVDHARKLIRA